MVRRYTYFITLAVFALAAMAVPQTRKIIRLHILSARHNIVYPGVVVDGGTWPTSLVRALESSRPVPEADWRDNLGMAGFENLALRPYVVPGPEPTLPELLTRKAVTVGPDHAETYAAALDSYGRQACFFREEEYPTSRKPSNLSESEQWINPKVGAEMLRLARQGSRIDPDNAFFALVEARTLFGLHRDAEALGVLHSASAKRRYYSYMPQLSFAQAAYMESLGFPRLEALASAQWGYGMHYRQYMRQVARVAASYGRRFDGTGRTAEAKRLIGDILRTAHLVQEGSTTWDEYWTGSAIQMTIATIDRVPKQHQPMLTSTEALNSSVESSLRRRGWNDLAETWVRQSRGQIAPDSPAADTMNPGSHGAVTALAASVASKLAFRVGLFLLLLGALSWGTAKLFRWNLSDAVGLSVPGKTGLLLLGFAPWLAASIAAMTSSSQTLILARFGVWLPDVGSSSHGYWALTADVVIFVMWSTAFALTTAYLPEKGRMWRGSQRILTGFAACMASITALDMMVLAVGGICGYSLSEAGYTAGVLSTATIIMAFLAVLVVIVQTTRGRGRGRDSLARAGALVLFLALGMSLILRAGAQGGAVMAVYPATAVLTLIVSTFIAGRTILLRRMAPQVDPGLGLLSTVRDSSVWLGKAFVLMYFVMLVGQLPLRNAAVQEVERLTRNQVHVESVQPR